MNTILSNDEVEQLKNRKGAQRRSEIPEPVLEALNSGKIETVNLVESLAIDLVQLLENILPEVGLGPDKDVILTAFRKEADAGIMRRMRTGGEILFQVIGNRPDGPETFERLACHTSDVVRGWAVFTLAADRAIPLRERLERSRRFAADSNMAVREYAWMGFRQYVARELDAGLCLLQDWVADEAPYIRRCAVEATRPRGVWTNHIPELKKDPERGLVLLNPVKADPNRYVQNAAANWLNDASKTKPEWVKAVCSTWEKESEAKETQYIVKRALRTLRKSSKF